jgi:hypothetical protein
LGGATFGGAVLGGAVFGGAVTAFVGGAALVDGGAVRPSIEVPPERRRPRRATGTKESPSRKTKPSSDQPTMEAESMPTILSDALEVDAPDRADSE